MIRWRVEPGQDVDEHQTLAEMETDKALVEVPSPWPGKVKELHGAPGDIIPVGSVLVSYSTGGMSDGGAGGTAEVKATDQSSEHEDVRAAHSFLHGTLLLWMQ